MSAIDAAIVESDPQLQEVRHYIQVVQTKAKIEPYESAHANPLDKTGSPFAAFKEVGRQSFMEKSFKQVLRLDVSLPAGFCSAIRMASFIATAPDRPDAFSLFACAPISGDRGSSLVERYDRLLMT